METNIDPIKNDRYKLHHLVLVEKTVKLLEIINVKLARFEKIMGKTNLVLPFTSMEYRAELMRETTENVEKWRKILEYHKQSLVEFERQYGLTNPDDTWAGSVNRWINRVKNLKDTVGRKMEWRNLDGEKASEKQKSHLELVEQTMELYEIVNAKLIRLKKIDGMKPRHRDISMQLRTEMMDYETERVVRFQRRLEYHKRRLTTFERKYGLVNPDDTWAGSVNRWINWMKNLKDSVKSRLPKSSK